MGYAYRFYIGILLVLLGYGAKAQSLGDPIVNITFGSGNSVHAGPLSPDSGSTTYTYSSGNPADGSYTIINTTANLHTTWWTTTDHTGNPGGYMMLVNASFDPGIFYTRNVVGLCGNTQYQFAAWVKNLINSNGPIQPNVTFTVQTTRGVILGTGTTGNIPVADKWVQYPITFTTPASADTLVLKMSNNAPGGNGNDLVIDDITFRPYGSQVSAVFSPPSFSQSVCANQPQTVTINATTTLASGYVQKPQMLVSNVWTDIAPASTATGFSFTSPTVAGTYYYRLVSALSANVSSALCVVSSNQLSLTVAAAPGSGFSVADTTCLSTSVVFTDTSKSGGGTITNWAWSFGDGQASTQQNPKHTYAAIGNYTVQLAVTTASGCTSSATPKTIHISGVPVAKFSFSSPDCLNQAITFTDASNSPEGSIKTWLWDYGDGTTETKTTNAPFTHTYTTTGSYPVTLVASNTVGCSTSIMHNVTINAIPVVNFGVPAICLTDGAATFTDSTTIADNSTLSYTWNFGDPSNTTSPNTSTQKNPTHIYTATGYYPVTLTVTSAAGCPVSATKTMTVNGAVPKAGLMVTGSQPYCSNREVDFQNLSTVDFGNITKVTIYFDYANDKTNTLTDNSPTPNKIYRHVYPEFHTPATKTYNVYMVAYSGTKCVSDTLKTMVTLLATPVVTFPAVAPICYGGGPVQLSVTPGSSAVTVSGIFTGTGVSTSGLFDPTVSGVGTFTIKYIYTANNACADTVSQTITVNPTPTVSAGANMLVLEGQSAKMKATASDSVTYSWSPATFLSSSTVPDPTVTPTSDITYTLTVTNTHGCSASNSVTVAVLKTPIIPNTFTPNGDGINDTWDIKYLNDYPDCTVDVYNRNGMKVFWSVGYPKAWDGRNNGAELPAGVYYYVINPKHGRGTMAGSITIIR